MKDLSVNIVPYAVTANPDQPLVNSFAVKHRLNVLEIESGVSIPNKNVIFKEIDNLTKWTGVLHPELLGALLARYSRNNEGYDDIISKIDISDPVKSVDGLFKFADYGHASIKGLTGGIPIRIEGLSMYAAYYMFSLASKSDGQESSTRYIQFNPDNLLSPHEAGLGDLSSSIQNEWFDLMSQGFDLQKNRASQLDDMVREDLTLARIPKGTKDAVANRMLKNYALDRSRYFLPFATQTNMALIMTGREWADIIKQVDSWPLPEFEHLAGKLRSEVGKAAPRCMRHSVADSHSKAQVAWQIDNLFRWHKSGQNIECIDDKCEVNITSNYSTLIPRVGSLEKAFDGKEHRYNLAGNPINLMTVSMAWNNMAIAEVRDLNRHRTGQKYGPIQMRGFYVPTDVNPRTKYENSFLHRKSELVKKIAHENPQSLVYTALLGDQIPFQHVQQADKAIYEMELRTGTGAHFRYAKHMRDAAEELFKIAPELGSYVQLGEAEPEGV